MECPIVKAIREIRGSGIFTDDMDSVKNVAKIGGSESSNEMVCEDMVF